MPCMQMLQYTGMLSDLKIFKISEVCFDLGISYPNPNEIQDCARNLFL